MKYDEYVKMDKTPQLMTISFSCAELVESTDEVVNFSGEVLPDVESDIVNMAYIRDYLREQLLTPRRVLDDRIRQVIRFVNSANPEKIKPQLNDIKRFITDYIQKYVSQATYDPQFSRMNITAMLNLNMYLTDKNNMRLFQQTLKRVSQQLSSTGTINPKSQKDLNTQYVALINDLFKTMDKSIVKEKQGILV